MSDKIHLAVITILIKDRQSHAADVNKILSKHGHIILARLGVNVTKTCVENCTGMISVAVEASMIDIRNITKELDELYGIVSKVSIMTD